MEKETKTKYEELAKKYKLPSFDSLNNEFEISTIEEKDFLLREIRRKISERIENYIKLLEGVLHPAESALCDMYECGIFLEEEKNQIFVLYKNLMFFDRFSVETSIGEDDKKNSDFIKEFWSQWENIKKELLPIFKNMKESWLKELKVKTELGYLG